MRSFTYHFKTEGETYSHTHVVGIPPQDAGELPDWTKLEYNQCDGCQWKETDRCPVAIGLMEPAMLLGKLKSFDRIDVVVESPERSYSKETTVQEGLSGLFGLIMATSGCPTFTFLKGLAAYHLPFASFEETLFRALSGYFIYNHLVGNDKSQDQTLADIKLLYDAVKRTNVGISNRLRNGVAPQTDSPMNAIVILDSFGALVPMSIEDGLGNLKQYFL